MGLFSSLFKATTGNSSGRATPNKDYRVKHDVIESGKPFPQGLLYLTPVDTVYPSKGNQTHTCYAFTDVRSHEALQVILRDLNTIITHASNLCGRPIKHLTEVSAAIPSMGITTDGVVGSPWAFTRAEYKSVTSSGNPNKTPMRLLLSSEYGVITGLIEADVKFDKDGNIKNGNITHHLNSNETLKTSFAAKRGKMYVTSVTCVNATNSSNSSVWYDQDNDNTEQSEIALDGSETPESEKLRSDCESCLTELINKAHELCRDVPLLSEFISSPLWEESLSYVIKDVEPTTSGRARKYAKTARVDLGCSINGGESVIVDLGYLPDGTIGKCRYIHWDNSVGSMVEIGDGILKRISVSNPTDGWDRVYDCRQQEYSNS